MIKSMTAYGRASIQDRGGFFTIEIVSINKKSLDMNLSIPREFVHLEVVMRKWLREKVARGMVTCRITKESQLPSSENLKAAKAHWEKVAEELGIKSTLSLEFLVNHATEAQTAGISEEEVRGPFFEALESLDSMRLAEGHALESDLRSRLDSIHSLLVEVEKSHEGILEMYRERLFSKMVEVVEIERDDTRILREAALFAEKADATEEIVRMKSHINQFLSRLDDCGPVGKRLDFLAQEMFREAQTLCAKSTKSESLQLLVEMKGEIEKIREQVQNIE